MDQRSDEFAIWRADRLGGMQMMRAAYSRHEYPRHWHDTYVIQVVESGVNVCDCQGAHLSMEAGALLVLHPHEVHDGRSTGTSPLHYRSIYPSVEFMKSLVPDSACPRAAPAFGQRTYRDGALTSRFLRAHRCLERDVNRFEGESMLIEFFAELFERAQPSIHEPQTTSCRRNVLRVRDLMEAYSSRPLSIDDLANAAGLSSFHFIRAFKAAFGMTPHEYLVNARVEQARELLLTSARPIAEIAGRAGFFDQSHLTRHFRRIIGVTPGVYRRSVN